MARSAAVRGAVAGLAIFLSAAAPQREALQPRDPTIDIAELWRDPVDLENRDLFNGQWGAGLAPDPTWTYVFVKPKTGGINPGMTVRDPRGANGKSSSRH